MMQMSAEGVGFPAGKTPKGVSCADGDVCDLDGRRNGVCVFRVSLCVNQPTRSCQPRSVTQASVKPNKKVDIAPLAAALAAVPLPTSATVCSPTALFSVTLPGPNKNGIVPSKQVAVKAVAKAGGTTDSDTYKLTCVPTTVAGGPTTTTTTLMPAPPNPAGSGVV